MLIQEYNLPELQLRVSPLANQDVTCIRQVNLDHDLIGALKKRSGYSTYLGTPDNNKVTALFNWTKDDGSTFWNYRVSGGILYYSTQGTGAWTVCGNGTLTNGATPGYTVLENTLILGDGTAATRHSTNGTSFTNTTSAPIASSFENYQGRVWAGGTASFAFYSTTGTPTDWVTDSSSILIPGPGRLNSVFKNSDRVIFAKNSGVMYRYDGYSLVDMTTRLGPTSPQSVGEIENFKFWLNRQGYYMYGGASPTLISNAIRRQIFNDRGSGIVGTVFNNAPSTTYQYQYYCAVGTVTDDLTDETLPRLVHIYDFQLNEFHNHQFAVLPTALLSYQDNNGNQQLIFGDSNGQCYQLDGTVNTDNGSPIEGLAEYVIHGQRPELLKKWDYLWMFFNPGCQARVQVCFADTFVKGKKIWIDLGAVSSGNVEFRLPEAARSKFMFLKVTDSSRNERFNFYGFAVQAEEIERS